MTPLMAVGLATSALGHCTIGSMRSVGNGEALEASAVLLDLVRRDWAVRVLDAWAQPKPPKRSWCGEWFKSGYMVTTSARWGTEEHVSYEAPDPDTARLAAAEAVLNELPESVRQELGPKP